MEMGVGVGQRQADSKRRFNILGRIWHHVPMLLFVVAIAMASFILGAVAYRDKLFPVSVIVDGKKTLETLVAVAKAHDLDILPGTSARSRRATAHHIRFLSGDALGGTVLWLGAKPQFLDHCPDAGCIAVEYTADGTVAHSYPYRPDELARAWHTGALDEYPYELSPAFNAAKHLKVMSGSRYPNGDLLAVFLTLHGFPYGGGVARIDRDGRPLWFRRDSSHHWGQVMDNDEAMIPGMRIGDGPVTFDLGRGETATLQCGSGKPYLDTVNFIDGNGRLLKEFSLVDALRDSPFASFLRYGGAADPCDMTHLNSVAQLKEDAKGTWGIASGDIVASLRNLSAFAILDGSDGRLKRLVRGSFTWQHGVRHWRGSKFLMLDNLGSDGTYGPSRVLEVDLADGRERTVFPNARTPEHLRGLYTRRAGDISISPDRRRAIATFWGSCVAVEISLPDGEVLAIFESHDMSKQQRISGAICTTMRMIEYISDTAAKAPTGG